MAPPPPRHSLEHAWTLWSDNLSAKQKQATWGSSIRPIYTFSSVEDFGGSFFFIYLNRTDSTSFVACERWLIQFSCDTFIDIFIVDSHFLSLTICAGSGFLGLFIVYIFVWFISS